ncbi:MAG: hypothetical protein LBI90_03000 [Treponema sp.]|jgi:hypothetical protein|nr:hypothetical protein [Treponema sp.]
MTIEQTVEIPASVGESRFVLQLIKDQQPFAEFPLPPTLPSGKAKVALSIDFEELNETDLPGMCLNPAAFVNPSKKQLKPLRGIAKGSSFTVEKLLQDRRTEE